MYQFFSVIFGILVILTLITRYLAKDVSSSSGDSLQKSPEFKAFQWNYLMIYYIMMSADWLQGPYVYALYESYGFDRSAIAFLFIGGFMSSMVFGTFVGSLADKYGRKLLCISFSIFYSISCLTKLVNDFNVLMVGRILSGIATSLLFSSFESWMIAEHNSKKFPPELISNTFSLATFGNGVVAILSGLSASFVADRFGFVAPFMVSLVLLIVGMFVIIFSWSENYGDSSVDVSGTFVNAWNSMKQDAKIPILGMIQSLFEASMYTFVFMWTPALQTAVSLANPDSTEINNLPFGLIFACFMVSIMLGSSIFGILLNKFKLSVEEVARILLFTAAISLAIPVYATNTTMVTVGFLLFETCCGIYFPCAGTLRSKYIPEATRSAVMNFFRVPLNFLVVVVLVKVGQLSNSTVFLLSTLWLGVAFLLQNQLKRLAISATKEEDSSSKIISTGGH